MQLSLDFESYNELDEFGAVLEPMDFNFNKDMEENALPPEWPAEDPENDGSDDES